MVPSIRIGSTALVAVLLAVVLIVATGLTVAAVVPRNSTDTLSEVAPIVVELPTSGEQPNADPSVTETPAPAGGTSPAPVAPVAPPPPVTVDDDGDDDDGTVDDDDGDD